MSNCKQGTDKHKNVTFLYNNTQNNVNNLPPLWTAMFLTRSKELHTL